MSKVMIVDVDKGSLEEAVREIFTEFKVDVREKKVLIKPNILGPFPPEKGVTTRPEVLEAVVNNVEAQGPRQIIVGDNPGGYNTNSYETARAAGLIEASKGYFQNISKKVIEVKSYSEHVKSFMISKIILDVDYIINLPCFKSHVFTIITGAVKNCFGYVAGANKAKYHLKTFSRRKFADLLVSLFQVRPPDLNIIDGLFAMEGDGPSHGTLRRLGKLLASTDAVAVDAVMSRMMNIDPKQVKHLAVAAERGMGEINIENMEIKGQLEIMEDFKLPAGFRSTPDEQGRILKELQSVVPFVDEERCSTCGECRDNCPPQAIEMDPYPRVDREKCIACFCCTELCPEGAMKIEEDIPDLLDKIF